MAYEKWMTNTMTHAVKLSILKCKCFMYGLYYLSVR